MYIILKLETCFLVDHNLKCKFFIETKVKLHNFVLFMTCMLIG